jgi:uncharacterized membrane protein
MHLASNRAERIAMTKLFLALHVLAVIIWVGGMFFAHMALRPAVAPLPPPTRLPLMVQVLDRFFMWVLASIAILLSSGLALIGAMGGMKAVGLYVHIMFGLGLLMMLIFGHIYFAAFRKLKTAVAAGDWPMAAKPMGQIRLLVGLNLVLGIATVLVVFFMRGM